MKTLFESWNNNKSIMREYCLTDFIFSGTKTIQAEGATITLGIFDGLGGSVHILGAKFRVLKWYLDEQGYRWCNVIGKGWKRTSPTSVFE